MAPRYPSARRLNASRRLGGRRGGAAKARNMKGKPPQPRRRPQTWKRRLGPEVEVVRTRIKACEGIPEIGRFPYYDCNRRRIVRYGAGNPGIRCRECRVALVFRKYLSIFDPPLVVALIQKLEREKKIGRLAKREPEYKKGRDV